TGFTRAFQAAAPKMFRNVRLDDPKIVALEYGLLSDVMGGEAELSRLGLLSFPEIEEVIKYAEKHRADGFRDIARKGFNFQQAMANSCGRHDNMLEVMIHSPQAAKVIAQFALVIVNAIAAGLALVLAETLFGFLIGAAVCIMTVVIVCILGKGC
ncbi:MAG TPA: hypothetical protein VJM80_01920, partial [bacterium]|nr:hypothetical protein [bacterium]